MSIQSEIDRLSGIKADLKAALAEKGQTVGDVFSTYPDAVRAIETGPKTANVDFGTAIPAATYIYSENGIVKKVEGYKEEASGVHKIATEGVLAILNIPDSSFYSLSISGGITQIADVSQSRSVFSFIYKITGDGVITVESGGSGGGSN